MRFLLVPVLASAVSLCGCEKRTPPGQPAGDVTENVANPAPVTHRLFSEPIEPQFYELPSQALVSWRRYAAQRPALVLLADQPYLTMPPGDALKEGRALLKSGSDQDLLRRGDYVQPDPLILAPQAVAAALAGKLFREVVWVLPDDRGLDKFSWEVLAEQLKQSRFISDLDDLRIDHVHAGLASFDFEGVVVEVVHPDGLKELELDTPAVLHVDLSYFKQTYRNEARIPAMQLLRTIAGMLQAADIRCFAATLSYSTIDGYVSLDGRFTLPLFADMLRNPGELSEPLPKLWTLWDMVLSAQTMYQEQRQTELSERILAFAPEDPAALYFAAQRKFYRQDYRAGLELLDKAVEIDPGYVVEYLRLSRRASYAGDENIALDLIDRALQVSPENPEYLWRRAVLLRTMGRNDEAAELARKLRQLNWSMTYHADVPEMLEAFLKDVTNPG